MMLFSARQWQGQWVRRNTKVHTVYSAELLREQALTSTLTKAGYVSINTYMLWDVLMCSIAEYFYSLFGILLAHVAQLLKILSDTTNQNV